MLITEEDAKRYKELSEMSLIAYFRAHGFDVHTFEDIIRLFVRETINENTYYQ